MTISATRLLGLGLLLSTSGCYLGFHHQSSLVCDRDTGACVLQQRRPLRDDVVRTFPLSEVLGVTSKFSYWDPSPRAAEILVRAKGMDDPLLQDLWVSNNDDSSRSILVVLTRTGILHVAPQSLAGGSNGEGIQQYEFQRFVEGRGRRGAIVLDNWREILMMAAMPLLAGALLASGVFG